MLSIMNSTPRYVYEFLKVANLYITQVWSLQKRKVLEEVIKTVTQNRKHCSELISLQKDLCVAQINTDLILSVPRVFSRSSARFELPMDSRTLNS